MPVVKTAMKDYLYLLIIPMPWNMNGWMSVILTKMFDLLLIFLNKGFVLFLLLFFGLFIRFRFHVDNALWRMRSGRESSRHTGFEGCED